jgi:hypothetical protein
MNNQRVGGGRQKRKNAKKQPPHFFVRHAVAQKKNIFAAAPALYLAYDRV